ncbi:Uncharacterised protein [Clostridium baratii]|uniref:hypothetical protein n=1 Tax=Clostridium baratii TaxID=1561 RepID=UPI0006C37489|nr:hypothetical protein [Clostridium baratii]CUO91287.1 Uncharacterised protein [Clostridium baratii]
MRDKIKNIIVFIKRKLGFCNFNGCWRRAYCELEISQYKVKRNLCEKHFDKFIDEL